MDKGHFTVWEEYKRPGKWGYTYWKRGRCCFTSCHEYASKRAAVQAIGRVGFPADVLIYDVEGNWLQPQ